MLIQNIDLKYRVRWESSMSLDLLLDYVKLTHFWQNYTTVTTVLISRIKINEFTLRTE